MPLSSSPREAGLASGDDKADAARWGDLLAAAQAGDAGAYRRFLTDILPFVRAVARRRCWSEDMAEDVVQDALLTLHRVRHTYELGRPVKPWLAAIVTRRAIDASRRRGRIGAQEVHNDVAYETFSETRPNEDDMRDAGRTLAGMTSGLSAGQKEAIDLVKLNEMSLAEASAASGQSVASLKVNIHRAIKKMRANLAGARED